jgi:peptidoglycan/LPS O-acetylase OafA/YrhL
MLVTLHFPGPVNVFLSAPVFQFLSKISYAIYLVHYELILVRAASYKTEIMIEHFYVVSWRVAILNYLIN